MCFLQNFVVATDLNYEENFKLVASINPFRDRIPVIPESELLTNK